jgi:hypothetical protein
VSVLAQIDRAIVPAASILLIVSTEQPRRRAAWGHESKSDGSEFTAEFFSRGLSGRSWARARDLTHPSLVVFDGAHQWFRLRQKGSARGVWACRSEIAATIRVLETIVRPRIGVASTMSTSLIRKRLDAIPGRVGRDV